jgi:DNA-binding NarL/FixJ family response regulator
VAGRRRILVVDRDSAFCSLAEEVAAREGHLSCIAHSGKQALEVVGGERPALAIVEVELPDLNGLAVLRELHETFGADVPVILVSAERSDPVDRTAGLLLGADDYLVKPVDGSELAARLRRSLRRRVGGNGFRDPDSVLSPREREILALLAAGRSQSDIAASLVISPKTVATHIQHLLAKLGVHSRAQAVAAAYRLGLVEPDVRAHALGVEIIAGG